MLDKGGYSSHTSWLYPSLILAALALVAALFSGCRGEGDGDGITTLTPEAPAIDESGITVYFPRQDPDTAEFMDADHRGPLMLDGNGCLRMVDSGGGSAYIVIWPPSGIRVSIVDGEVALVSEERGDLIAHVGDWIMLGGGGPVDDPSLFIDRPLPEPCAGESERYWISGSAQSIRPIPPER